MSGLAGVSVPPELPCVAGFASRGWGPMDLRPGAPRQVSPMFLETKDLYVDANICSHLYWPCPMILSYVVDLAKNSPIESIARTV